jgi:phosphomannomutase
MILKERPQAMRNYIFDVDGTLTVSRMKIDKEFGNWFEHFATHNACYIVTGSDREKTLEQVGSTIYNLCIRVYNCSGNDVYEQGKNLYAAEWTMPEDVKADLQVFLDESKFYAKTGLHFDTRPGLVNFSILGRRNTLEERAMYIQWDEHKQERVKIAEAMRAKYPDILFEVAGDTGLDITLPSSDKSQVLKDFEGSYENTVFFGDKIIPGGNDYSVAVKLKELGGEYYKVDSWEETWKILKQSA